MTIYKYAGFWRRFIAYTIDMTIITFIFSVLATIASVAFFSGAISGNRMAFLENLMTPEGFYSVFTFIWIFFICIFIAYFTHFHGATGRTPGKMLSGLQVVYDDGMNISFGSAFLRAVGYLVSSIFNLGFIWIAFDKQKQGWHDKIAGTVVIIRDPQDDRPGISIPDNPPVATMTQHYEGQGKPPVDSASQPDKPTENRDN